MMGDERINMTILLIDNRILILGIENWERQNYEICKNIEGRTPTLTTLAMTIHGIRRNWSLTNKYLLVDLKFGL
jgi:hypothetical protein